MVKAGPADAEQGALSYCGKDPMPTLHHLPPSFPAHGPSFSANPSGEGPLDLQLADLLVEPSDEDRIALLAFVLVPIKDAGRPFQQGLLPSLDLAGMDLVSFRGRTSWVTVCSPFSASRATLALNVGLCFLRSFDMSHSSSRQQPLSVILGAELSLNHLSKFPGPPQ